MHGVSQLNPTAATLLAINRKPPRGSADYDRWIQQDDLIAFLRQQQTSDEIVLYASADHLFLYSVLVPNAALNPIDQDDILEWNCTPGDGWCTSYWKEEGQEHTDVHAPLQSCGSETIAKGEQLIFARDFEGHRDQPHYFELSQKIAQLIDVHLMPERHSYCRLDNNGDIEDIVRILTIDGGQIITIKRDSLDGLLRLMRSTLLLLFDTTRVDFKTFTGWAQGEEDPIVYTEDHICYRGQTNVGAESYRRGFAAIPPREASRTKTQKQYATFITNDWKNNTIREWSCDPKQLGNYFTKSELPYTTSPVFFRPEVLQRYKSDSDKYTINARSITCRGTWSLKTYDINEANQVHTYLGYLGDLPHAEQLYWKSFNEAPKSVISKRAFKTDFLAEFDNSYDPLASLKRRLEQLHKQNVPWWHLKDQKLPQTVHYPLTDSQDEWANELMALDQLLVEGLDRNHFKGKALGLSIKVDPQWGSLILIENALKAQSINADETTAIIAQLKSLHMLRSKMKGHVGGSDAKQIRKDIIATHGTLKAHYRALAVECDRAIQLLAEMHSDGII